MWVNGVGEGYRGGQSTPAFTLAQGVDTPLGDARLDAIEQCLEGTTLAADGN
jgi:hypothetical protein